MNPIEIVEKSMRAIPDFPKKGIMFRDITTALKNPESFKAMIDFFVSQLKDVEFDAVVAVESRGFFLAAPVAYLMNKGLIVVRKPGKLPAESISAEYDLEYGSDKLEMHVDALKAGQKVIIMDDLIATGGTLGASIELVEKLGASAIKSLFLIELEDLGAKEKFANKTEIISMLKY